MTRRSGRVLVAGLGIACLAMWVYLQSGEQVAHAQTIALPQAAIAGDSELSQPGTSFWDLSETERNAYYFGEDYVDIEDEDLLYGPPTAEAAAQNSANAGMQLYIPGVQRQGITLSNRLGFGVAWPKNITDLPRSQLLRAGWYLDWGVRSSPARPDGIEYVQMVRVRQALAEVPFVTEPEVIMCGPKVTRDRQRCPYLLDENGQYVYYLGQSHGQIIAAARQNRGSIWLIGNEMDRRDWGGGGQDEILPEVYARAYHEAYHVIKQADPTARVAIGGIIQPTPLRLEYLTRVWDSYKDQFGTEMPVDVWNTHNFMVEEKALDFGADIPPGIGDNNTIGEYVYFRDAEGNFQLDGNGNRIPYPSYASYHMNMYYFDKQIRAFRQWMKDRGQQDKPLIVTEYGVLIPHWWLYPGSNPEYNWDDPTPVINFMISTFNYFLHERDCNLGYPRDECRLVQAWNWFSLNPYGGHNPHTALMNAQSGEFTATGLAFQQYSLENLPQLVRRYPIPLTYR